MVDPPLSTIPRHLFHLYHDVSPAKQFLHLACYLGISSFAVVCAQNLGLVLLLKLQVRHGSVDATDLPVWPAPHSMPTAQPFQSRDRDVHGLVKKEGNNVYIYENSYRESAIRNTLGFSCFLFFSAVRFNPSLSSGRSLEYQGL